jgi:hypothetical protein
VGVTGCSPDARYCPCPSSVPLLVQAYTIIAFHFIILLLVVAQEAQVENPCLICPDGVYDPLYAPYVY